MKTDLNKAMYMVKKMIKQIEKNTLEKEQTCKQLSLIVAFTRDENLSSAQKIAKECLNKAVYNVDSLNTIELKRLMTLLQAKKEKLQVMAIREAKARYSYFNRMNKTTNKKNNLLVYDVIKVPTQGGIHYSVVTNISDNIVECFPITTAKKSQLAKIGCQYYKLQCKTSDGGSLYLTNSKTKLPLHAAEKSYTHSYGNPAEIDKALLKFAN
jgi:hypothetical protein